MLAWCFVSVLCWKVRHHLSLLFLICLSKQTFLSIILYFSFFSVARIHLPHCLLQHPLPTKLVAFLSFGIFLVFCFHDCCFFFITSFLTKPSIKCNMLSSLFGFLVVVFGSFGFCYFLASSLFCSQTLSGSVPSLFQRAFRYFCFAVALSSFLLRLLVTALSLWSSSLTLPLPLVCRFILYVFSCFYS